MKTSSSGRASALIFVRWALFLLSAAVFAWVKIIQQDIEISGRENRNIEALAMAHSGIAIGLHPLVSRKTPLLEEQIADDMGYRVTMVSEGGKLNINWLIAGEEPRKLEILKQWLALMDLNFKDREIFVDSLLDYVDGDNDPHLNGIEDKDDYHPANRPLQSIDEIRLVANAKLLTEKPGWKDQLTIHAMDQYPILDYYDNLYH